VARLPLRLHLSWVVVVLLVPSALSLSDAPAGGTHAPVVGLVTSLAFFAALVAHEVGQGLVARRAGIGVSSITLFVFGGVASLEGEPQRPRDELAIAIAGPIVSVLIAAGAFALSLLPFPPIVVEPLRWLARVNAGVAVFNLLPGFPLDGGRVLRGILWAAWGDAYRATTAAARAGRGIAYAMIALAVAMGVFGFIGDAIWIGLVGWFLLSAARAAVAGIPTIPAAASVATYVNFVMSTGDRRPFLVVDHERSLGAITVDRALSVPPQFRQVVTMGELATEVAA
jgi:Zn-dependent protease